MYGLKHYGAQLLGTAIGIDMLLNGFELSALFEEVGDWYLQEACCISALCIGQYLLIAN